MSRAKALLFSCLISIFTLVTHSLQKAEPVQAIPTAEEYVFYRSWGGEGNQIRYPAGLAVDPEGNLYIANDGLNRVTVISNERATVTWGGFGSDAGEFSSPVDVAFDANGNLFVVDAGNDRIQKFAANGQFLQQWGSNGSAAGQFDNPLNIAIDQDGNVYVTEGYNNRVQKFSNQGNFIRQWGEFGTEIGQFWSLSGIAVNSQGNIYVSDKGNERISIFDADGNYIANWNLESDDIALDSNDNLVILIGNTIQKYGSPGLLLAEWQVADMEEPAYSEASLAIDVNSNIYVSDPRTDRILKYSNSGQFLTQWEGDRTAPGQFQSPTSITLDNQDIVYVADWRNSRIQKFTLSGTYAEEFESFSAHSVAVADDGTIFLVGYTLPWIQKLDNEANLIFEWGDWWGSPSDIVIGSDNNVYLADGAYSSAILKFDVNGNLLDGWGYLYGDQDGEFDWISGLAIDTNNNTYATDPYLDRVQKFTSDGQFITKWGEEGSGPGQFDYPNGIAVDNLGNVYVADFGNGRIQKFTLDGTYLTEWDETSSGIGNFGSPSGIAVDSKGFVYVTEQNNHRVQVFRPGHALPDLVTGLMLNGSFETAPALTEWTTGGNLTAAISNNASHGDISLQLGQPANQTEQGAGEAWTYQTIYVDPNWERPVLSFRYNLFVNDLVDFSDFFVAIQDGLGLNHLATVLRDGFQPCQVGVPPQAGTDMGWREHKYDLSSYKGEYIRIVFSNRNLHPNSWGIWTYLDDVRILDAGALPSGGSQTLFLPMLLNNFDPTQNCDSIYGSPFALNHEKQIRVAP